MKQIFFFFFTLTLYSSQDSMIVFSSGQKHLYSKKILTEDVLKNFQDMQVAFNAKDYRLAATLGVGASRYAHIMALPQIDPVVAKSIDFIIAKSHMKLNSPQHALSAFENIHDKETKYGIITSTDIAMCFASKKETLLPENPLFQKLSEYIDTFEQYAVEARINSYIQEFKRLSVYESKKIKNISIPLCTIILDMCAIIHSIRPIGKELLAQIENNFIKQIQQIEIHNDFEKMIKIFTVNNEKCAIPLLQLLLNVALTPQKAIAYLLGLFHYYKMEPDYREALHYFQLSEQDKFDFLTHCLCFMCWKKINLSRSEKRVSFLMALLKQSNTVSKKLSRNKRADDMLHHHLINYGINYVVKLCNQNNYSLACELCVALLQKDKIAPVIIEFIKHMYVCLNTPKNQDNAYFFNQFYSVALHRALLACSSKNYPSLVLLNLAQLFAELMNRVPTHDAGYYGIIEAIEECLQKVEKDKLFVQVYKAGVADLYYIVGQKRHSIRLLDKAIAFGNIDAYYEKAVTLLQQVPTRTTEQTAIELLKKHAESTSLLRYKSQYKLGELYFDYTTRNPFLTYVKVDSEQAFSYFKKAAENNNMQNYDLLAALYAQKNQDYFIAFRYFQQSIALPSDYKAETLFLRAITYYHNNLFEQALEDFESIVSSEIQSRQKIVILLYIAATALQMNRHKKAITCLRTILKRKDFNHSLINDEVKSVFIQRISSIIDENRKDSNDIQLCSLLGRLLCMSKSCNNCEEKALFKHGVRSLRYAGDHDNYEAQLCIGKLSEEYVDLADAISYLLMAYQKDTDDKVVEKAILARLPDDIVNHYKLFIHYYKLDPIMACNYLMAVVLCNGNIFMPLYHSAEYIKGLLYDCNQNQFLKELAQNFIQKLSAAEVHEASAAALLACMYAYSNKKTDLLKSAQFFTALEKIPRLKSLSLYLGKVYYKLGMIAKSEGVSFLYVEYLKKSANCEFLNAIEIIKSEVLKKNPLFDKISVSDMKKWLEVSENYSVTPLSTMKELRAKQQSFNVIDDVNPDISSKLYGSTKSLFLENQQYMRAAVINPKNVRQASMLLQKLVKKTPHPHAYFLLAVNKSEDSDLFSTYINKCFKIGIISKKKKEHSVFVDKILLGLIHDFVVTITINETDKTSELLTILVHQLIQYNININDFKQLLLHSNRINLDVYLQ